MKINRRYDRRGRFVRMVLDFCSVYLAYQRMEKSGERVRKRPRLVQFFLAGANKQLTDRRGSGRYV
jgi:hypothetical protein